MTGFRAASRREAERRVSTMLKMQKAAEIGGPSLICLALRV
jgi:hypothetical protein